ncbi:MAG TPA: DUF2934 domain-containing protein [Acetobacteraceae bacterium]|nr:DUF2934 domain-containing protein [Acetobacteraceae bacterium]
MPDDTHDSEESLRRHAYELWERAGRPEGRSEEFWHRARVELGLVAPPNPTDLAIEDTFPASDPPASTGVIGPGKPRP